MSGYFTVIVDIDRFSLPPGRVLELGPLLYIRCVSCTTRPKLGDFWAMAFFLLYLKVGVNWIDVEIPKRHWERIGGKA